MGEGRKEILELKSTVIEIKNLLEEFKSRLQLVNEPVI